MQNRSLENTVYVMTAAFFGVFLRWMQLQLAFDDKGLCGPSVFNVIVPVFILTVAWLLRRRIGRLLGSRYTVPGDLQSALANPGKLYGFLRWFAGVLMMLGGVLVIRGSETQKYVIMLRLLGGLAIVTGLCFPLLLEEANRPASRKKTGILCLISFLPILLFAFWMIYLYRSNAINSVLWAFVIEVAAVSTLMIAFFRLAGFAFGLTDAKKLLFWLQFGAFLSVVALADSRITGMQVIFLASAVMLALTDFILLGHITEKTDEPEQEEPPSYDGGFEELK